MLFPVASLDVVQAAFGVHLIAFCITCAVLVWTNDWKNTFGLSLGFPVGHFVFLSFIIWDCEPLFFVVKTVVISCLWFGTRFMRISSSRLVRALEQKPKSRVRVTIVQLLIGASLLLVASLHLAYPEHEFFSVAEMALWGCFIVDVLWHFGIWKMTMKRVFQGVKGMHKTLSRRNANLNRVEGAKRRENIATTLGVLFTEIISCACMIVANPALDLLLQDKSDKCKQRSSVDSHRLSAFGFAIFLAFHITFLLGIYTRELKKRRSQKVGGSLVNALQQVVVLPHHGPNSGLAKTSKAPNRNEMSQFLLTFSFATLHTRTVVPQFQHSLVEMCHEAEVSSPSAVINSRVA